MGVFREIRDVFGYQKGRIGHCKGLVEYNLTLLHSDGVLSFLLHLQFLYGIGRKQGWLGSPKIAFLVGNVFFCWFFGWLCVYTTVYLATKKCNHVFYINSTTID